MRLSLFTSLVAFGLTIGLAGTSFAGAGLGDTDGATSSTTTSTCAETPATRLSWIRTVTAAETPVMAITTMTGMWMVRIS